MRDFNHSVKILVNAFFTGTLAHRDCTACAVGNLIQGNGYKLKKDQGSTYTFWLRYIETEIRKNSSHYEYDEAIAQICSTGYSAIELHRIERAFEGSYVYDKEDYSDREDQKFNGLMAVVDVLADIHSIDLSVREEAKLLFVKV